MRHSPQSGFTLIETLIVMTLVAILLAIGVPSFTSFNSRYQLTTASNDFLSALLLARNEAMKRGRRVDMIPVTGTDWTSGWIVFVDRNNNQQLDPSASPAEDIITQHAALPSSITVSGTTDSCAKASGNPAFKSGSKSYIAYFGTGYPNKAGGIAFSKDSYSRILCMNIIGRPRVIDGT